MSDVTRFKIRGRERRKSEERYKAFFNSASHGIFVTCIDAPEISYVNPALCKLLGYTEDELKQKSLADIYPDEAWKHILSKVPTDANGDHELATNVPCLRKDGTTIYVNIHASYATFDGKECRVAFITDITEGKKAESLLRESEKLFRSLVENSPDVILQIDRDGRILFTNYLSPGMEKRDVLGKTIYDFMPSEYHDAAKAAVEKRFTTGESSRYESRGGGPGESTSWYTSRMGPLKIGEKTVEATLVISDITERKRMDEQLQRTSEELARSNKELEDFASVASHDLQAPLRHISSFTRLLVEKYGERADPEVEKWCGYIQAGVDRMQTLIGDLLKFSRVGRKPLQWEKTDLQALVASALEELQESILETGAEIAYRDLPEIHGDASLIRKVFQNLIENALKFRKEGQVPRIEIGTEKLPAQWKFWVRDNGIGIDPQYFDRIFQIFQRLHTTEEYPGTGIGLALCEKIIGLHRGMIWIESEMGKGSTVFFTISKLVVKEAKQKESQNVKNRSGSPC